MKLHPGLEAGFLRCESLGSTGKGRSLHETVEMGHLGWFILDSSKLVGGFQGRPEPIKTTDIPWVFPGVLHLHADQQRNVRLANVQNGHAPK